MAVRDSSPIAPALEALLDVDLYKGLIDEVGEGVYIVDAERRILYWNGGAEQITGYKEHEVVGRYCHGDLLMHCDSDGRILCGDGCPLSRVLADGVPRDCTVFLRHQHGHRIPVDVRSRPIRNAAGAIVGAIELFQQAAPARAEQAALNAFGCMDDLTGLPNRAYGELLAEQALAARKRFNMPFGWIRFELNDGAQLVRQYGHGVLNAALLLISRTLNSNLGRFDILAYWGDSQFRVGAHYASAAELAEFARELGVLVHLSNLEWWGDPLSITVSIGVASARPGDSLLALEARVAENSTAISSSKQCSE